MESPQKLTDEDLEMMIGIWIRKARRIVVSLSTVVLNSRDW